MIDAGNRHETILKHIRDGVYTLDASGQITWVNKTAVENFEIGYTRDELIGAPVSKVLRDADLEKCLSIIRKLLKSDTEESGRCEIMFQTASGDGIPCDLHLALLPAENGEFQGTVGVVREITDRKRREQRLEVLNRVLRHNLSNAMTVILGRAEQLEQGVDQEYKPMVNAIRERGEELIELSEKVRQIHKINTTAAAPKDSIDLVRPLEQTLAAFREKYPRVEFEVVAPAEAYTATGNEALITTALSNLLENAIEHNDDSHPFVSITVQLNSECAQIRVEDNGPGLPPLEKEVLESGSESPLQHSLGIGLWLASWSMSACNGKIHFDEASPHGTIVTMEFPIAAASDK